MPRLFLLLPRPPPVSFFLHLLFSPFRFNVILPYELYDIPPLVRTSSHSVFPSDVSVFSTTFGRNDRYHARNQSRIVY